MGGRRGKSKSLIYYTKFILIYKLIMTSMEDNIHTIVIRPDTLDCLSPALLGVAILAAGAELMGDEVAEEDVEDVEAVEDEEAALLEEEESRAGEAE